ncbi:MAG: hypothetical protein KDD47_03015 [Acidobacteria bacterium]|nr:hypothetical protein [Acidobacteriota bacterium]
MPRKASVLAALSAFVLLVPTLATGAEEVQLLFHHQVVGDLEVIHASSLVPQSPPPPGPPPSLQEQAEHAAIQWLTTRGIFEISQITEFGFEGHVTNDSITLEWKGPGGVVIILSNGPFFPGPGPADWLINLVVVRNINNGF